MTNDEIETLVAQCGYAKKLQPDGTMAFHPHVFESHRKAHTMGVIKGIEVTLKMLRSKNAEFYNEILDLKFDFEQELEYGVSHDAD